MRVCKKRRVGENEKCSQRNGILCILTFFPSLSCLFSLSSPFSFCSLPWYICQWVDKKEKRAFCLWFFLKFPNTVPLFFPPSLNPLGRGFLLLLGGAKFQLRNFGFQLPTGGFKKIPSAGILATTASQLLLSSRSPFKCPGTRPLEKGGLSPNGLGEMLWERGQRARYSLPV